MADASTLAALRARIRSLEGGGAAPGTVRATLDRGVIDGHLPWGGLPGRSLHEIGGSLATGLAAALAGRFLQDAGVLVWCLDAALAARHGRLYGPGLARFGIDPARLILVRCRRTVESLWAAHEALRSPAVACVVAEVGRLDLLAGRRLQLAAEAGGGAGLLLRFGHADGTPSAAVTRWRAAPFLSDDFGAVARFWLLELWRVKGGMPASWVVRWDEETLSFAAAREPVDRSAAPGRRAAG